MKKWTKYGLIGLAILIPLVAMAADTRISTDQLILGRKLSGNVDKTIQFDIGAGSTSNPKLKWQSSTSQFTFANDGVTFQGFGTGSGSGGSGINLLAGTGNGNFELGTTGWTASGGGTIATVTTAPNLIDGLKTGIWTPSAGSQTLSSTLEPLASVAGLQGANCAATALYKTAEGTNVYSWEVVDNSSNVLAGPVTLQQTTNISAGAQQATKLTFICPTSGSVQVKFLAASSTPSDPLYVDDVTLGSNALVDVSQAQFFGSVDFATNGSCVWQNTGTSFSNYTAVAACSSPIATGQASAPGTKIPAIVFSSMPAGTYYFVASGMFDQSGSTSNTIGTFRFTDGTNFWGAQSQYNLISVAANINTGVPNIAGSITYPTSQTNVTVQIQSKLNASGPTLEINATQNPFHIDVYYFPNGSSQGFRTDQVGWKVDASINGGSGNNINLGTTGTVTNVVNPGNANLSMVLNNNSITTQIPCSGTNPSTGLTCAAGTPQSGIVFNAPTSGPVRVCTSFSLNISTAGGGSVEDVLYIAETPNNSDSTITQSGKTFVEVSNLTASNNQVFPTYICEDMPFMSAGQHTLRLFYSNQVSGTVSEDQILVDNTGPGSQRNTRWTVIPLGQNITQPVVLPGRIYASYYQDGAGNTTPGSGNPIVFANKDADTNNAVSGGRFTAPLAGPYQACITNNGSGTGTIFLYKNAVNVRLVTETMGAGSGGCVGITLVQGDIIDFRDNNSSTYNSGSMSFALIK